MKSQTYPKLEWCSVVMELFTSTARTCESNIFCCQPATLFIELHFSNKNCSKCYARLSVDGGFIQFDPRETCGDDMASQLNDIGLQLEELKSLLEERTAAQIQTNQTVM